VSKELDASEAVRHAKRWVASIYSDEHIANLGLEEVRWNDGNWEITIGFDRFPSADELGLPTIGFLAKSRSRRDYKVIVMSGEDNAVLEMRNREVA